MAEGATATPGRHLSRLPFLVAPSEARRTAVRRPWWIATSARGAASTRGVGWEPTTSDPSETRDGVRRPGASGGPRRRLLGGRRLLTRSRRTEDAVEIDRGRVEVGLSVAVDRQQVAQLLPDPLSGGVVTCCSQEDPPEALVVAVGQLALAGGPRCELRVPVRRASSARATAASTISATMA